jgi:hypothetical protein
MWRDKKRERYLLLGPSNPSRPSSLLPVTKKKKKKKKKKREMLKVV